MKLTRQSLFAFFVLFGAKGADAANKNKEALGRLKGDQTKNRNRQLQRQLKGKGDGKGGKGLITAQAFKDSQAKIAETTIDCDLKLTEDIDCSYLTGSEVCLKLASGVTLDCDGYTIKGPGPDGESPWTVGIQTEDIDAGDTTTIKNCNIEGFDFCVHAVDSAVAPPTYAPAPGEPIFYNEVGSNPSPDCTCRDELDDGSDCSVNQCCPHKAAIDGMARIETTTASGCFYGYLTSRVIAEFYDVVATENTARGFQFQVCSMISLEEIYACKNGVDDIRYNDGWQNSGYIAAAAGTIRADNINENNSGFSPGPETEINGFLSPNTIQGCFVEDACGTTFL